MLEFIRNITSRRDEDGASAVEYGLLVAGIAALIVAIVFALRRRHQETPSSSTCKHRSQSTLPAADTTAPLTTSAGEPCVVSGIARPDDGSPWSTDAPLVRRRHSEDGAPRRVRPPAAASRTGRSQRVLRAGAAVQHPAVHHSAAMSHRHEVGTRCLRDHGAQGESAAPQRARPSIAPDYRGVVSRRHASRPVGSPLVTRPGAHVRPAPACQRAQCCCSSARAMPMRCNVRRVRPEPELAQPGRVVVAERADGQLRLHPLEPAVVPGRLQRRPVRPGLDRPG